LHGSTLHLHGTGGTGSVQVQRAQATRAPSSSREIDHVSPQYSQRLKSIVREKKSAMAPPLKSAFITIYFFLATVMMIKDNTQSLSDEAHRW